MSTFEKPSVDSYSKQRDKWHQVNDCFDLEDGAGVISRRMTYDCVRCKTYPYPVMVKLYAKVGLHLYNMFKETNYQLDSLVQFNMLHNYLSSFCITLLAHDPALDPLEKTFQVQVVEEKVICLDITCTIARLKDGGTGSPLYQTFMMQQMRNCLQIVSSKVNCLIGRQMML